MKPNILEEDEIEIIDAHGHLGDIGRRGGGDIIHQTGIKGKSILDTGWLAALFEFKFGELKEPNKLARALATHSGRVRIAGATLENMQAELARARVSQVCCLPVYPNVTFYDLWKAKEKDDRVIPFTGFNFRDMEGCEERIIRDVELGAKGMKLHPILQNIDPRDERVRQVAEEFGGKHGLPILFHTGRTTYYFGKDKKKENPDYGRLELMEELVASLRSDIPIILGHAGMFQFEYVAEKFGQYPNVHVDTTFQHPERIQQLLKVFGTGRVVYGADWPYADMAPSIECVEVALQQFGDRKAYAKVFRDNIKGLMGME